MYYVEIKEFNEALEKKSFYREAVSNITIGHLS